LTEVRTKGNMAMTIASSGIVATLLDGGRIAHQFSNCHRIFKQMKTPYATLNNTQVWLKLA